MKTAFIKARGMRYMTNSRLPMGLWRTVDKGFIRYNNGKILVKNAGKDLTTHEIYMVNLTGEWGINLWDYEDATGVNDAGQGSVVQPWAISIGVGGVSWTLLD